MRKLAATFIVLAAVAVLAPATALALNTPVLTHPTGTVLAAGAKLKATNIGAIKMTSAAGGVVVECTTAFLTGSLSRNMENSVQITVETATLTSGGAQCTGLGGVTVTTNVGAGTPWCMYSNETMTDDEIRIGGEKCGGAVRPITFVLDTALWGVCKYEKFGVITGIYLTDTLVNSNSDAIVQVSKAKFVREEGSVNCPSETFLDMSFTLETNTLSAEPFYFS